MFAGDGHTFAFFTFAALGAGRFFGVSGSGHADSAGLGCKEGLGVVFNAGADDVDAAVDVAVDYACGQRL